MNIHYQDASTQRKRWIAGVLSILVLTAILAASPLGLVLNELSFAIPFWFRPNRNATAVAVVLEDRASLDALDEKVFPPSREIHSRLLTKLHAEDASWVLFDISFRNPKPGNDEMFAKAIHEHGRVLLGGVTEEHSVGGASSYGSRVREVRPPTKALRDAAVNWGLLSVDAPDGSLGARRILTEYGDEQTAIGVLALSNHINTAKLGNAWLNYYGPSPALPTYTLGQVLEVDGQRLASNTLRGKIVFVGFDPAAAPASDRRDVFATPYLQSAPGVEILAASFANLQDGSWLKRIPLPFQIGMTIAATTLTLLLLLAVGRRLLWITATATIVLFSILSGAAHGWLHFWWNWTVVAFFALPLTAALAYLFPKLSIVAFLSYRRNGGDGFVMAVLHELRARGLDALTDKNFTAGDFPPQIIRDIRRAGCVVLVLSPGALDPQSTKPMVETTSARDNTDWLREEITYALNNNIEVIPILLPGYEWSDTDILPPDLRNALRKKQSIYHRADAWPHTIAKLLELLKDASRLPSANSPTKVAASA
jgi:CHASE2 domain-containing sensor protein